MPGLTEALQDYSQGIHTDDVEGTDWLVIREGKRWHLSTEILPSSCLACSRNFGHLN